MSVIGPVVTSGRSATSPGTITSSTPSSSSAAEGSTETISAWA
ncbi:MAG TPA: hypothetical protein VGA45_15550 [Actinomycetota bacterium]